MIWLLSFALAAPPNQTSLALRRGDCHQAIQLSPAPVEDHYKLAIGRCYIQSGDVREASSLLESIDGPLKPYALLLRAEGALLINERYEAQVLADQAIQTAAIQEQAMVIKAKAAIANEQYILARDTLRPLLIGKRTKAGYIPGPTDIDPAEVRWLLAEGARLRGTPQAAIPVYWKIWTDNPTSSYAKKAELTLIALGHRVPDSTTQTGRNYIEQRARTFRKLYLHKEALSLLDLLPQETTQTEIRKYAYYAFSAKDYPRSLRTFQRLTNADAEDLFHMALASVRSGDYDSSAAYYIQLYTTFPNHKRADTASFKVGYLKYDAGLLEEALPLFRAHLERFPKSRHADETRYFMGWSLTRLQRYDEAKIAFQLVQRLHPSSSLAPGAAYWLAYILEQEGSAAAEKSYRRVLANWPSSGYAWQAAHQLKHSYPAQEIVTVPAPPNAIDTPQFHLGAALSEVGLNLWAQQMLLPLASKTKGDKLASLVLAHALIDAGAYKKAQQLAKPHCTKPWKNGDPLAMQACFPQPNRDIIESTIGDHALDRNLPYAIMTAESALQPEVSSPAGARGLMQLMPEVAEGLHQRVYPNQIFDPDVLFESGYNATLGTSELLNLHTSFEEQSITSSLPLVIAGYNGGEEAVRRWMALYDEPPTPAQFSDDIGYTETRRYVRRVLGYLMNYRYIYGDSI